MRFPFKLLAPLLVGLLSFFISPSLIAAAEAPSTERIVDYDAKYNILSDGNLDVTESIKVFANNDKIRHGIYRDIPTIFKHKGGEVTPVQFTVTKVLRDGNPEPYSILDIKDGKRINIGDPETILRKGMHTYVIFYKVDNQIGIFEDHDELHWNVNGNTWTLPIDKVQAEVTLPAGAKPIKAEAYTGFEGGAGQNYQVTHTNDGKILFSTIKPLANHESLFIWVAWPKGFMKDENPNRTSGQNPIKVSTTESSMQPEEPNDASNPTLRNNVLDNPSDPSANNPPADTSVNRPDNLPDDSD